MKTRNREDVAIPPGRCPACNKYLDSATPADGSDARPEPGNWTICWGCGVALVFMKGNRLRAATPADASELSEEDARTVARATSAVMNHLLRQRLS